MEQAKEPRTDMTHTRNRCRVKIEDTAPQMTMADVLRERLRLNPPDQQVVWNNCFTRQPSK